jgi:hypothetical protein
VTGPRDAYGPVMVLRCGAKGDHEPLDVVRHMAPAEAACRLEAQRFRLETLSQTRKVEGSIFLSRRCPMDSACHGSSSPRVSPLYGWCIEDREVKKSSGDLSCIVGNAVIEGFSS